MANPAPRPGSKFKPGRKAGSKNRVHGDAKQAMLDCFERAGREQPDLLYQVLIDGLNAGGMISLGFLRLWADYSLQKPEQRMKIDGTVRKVIRVILPSREAMETPTLEAEYTADDAEPAPQHALTQAAVSRFLEQSKD